MYNEASDKNKTFPAVSDKEEGELYCFGSKKSVK